MKTDLNPYLKMLEEERDLDFSHVDTRILTKDRIYYFQRITRTELDPEIKARIKALTDSYNTSLDKIPRDYSQVSYKKIHCTE